MDHVIIIIHRNIRCLWTTFYTWLKGICVFVAATSKAAYQASFKTSSKYIYGIVFEAAIIPCIISKVVELEEDPIKEFITIWNFKGIVVIGHFCFARTSWVLTSALVNTKHDRDDVEVIQWFFFVVGHFIWDKMFIPHKHNSWWMWTF